MLRFTIAFILVGLLVCAGCNRNKRVEDKTAATVAGGNAKVLVGADGLDKVFGDLLVSSLNDAQKSSVVEGQGHVAVVRTGNAEMKKACDEAVKRGDPIRQQRDLKLNDRIILGITIFAIGCAVMMLAVKWPVASVVGGAVAVGGAAMGVLSFAFQIADPWVRVGVGAATIIGIALVVYRLVMKEYQATRQKKELKVERVATEELVQTIDAAKPRLPEYARKELFGDERQAGTVAAIQSPSTQELVAKVREEKKNGDADRVTPVSGVVIGTTGAASVSGSVSSDST